MRVPREDSYRPDEDPTSKPTPEKPLWCGVILLAAQDSKSPVTSLRTAVAAWIQTADFITVCGYADQDPESTRKGLQRLLNGPRRQGSSLSTKEAQAERNRHAKAARLQQITHLRNQGHSLESIARQTGLSKAGVSRIIQYQPVDNSV